MNYLRVNPKLFEITRLGDNKNLSRFVSEIVGKKTEMAEGVGFEPTIRYNRIPDFESGAFDLSAILPTECRQRILPKLGDFVKLAKLFSV